MNQRKKMPVLSPHQKLNSASEKVFSFPLKEIFLWLSSSKSLSISCFIYKFSIFLTNSFAMMSSSLRSKSIPCCCWLCEIFYLLTVHEGRDSCIFLSRSSRSNKSDDHSSTIFRHSRYFVLFLFLQYVRGSGMKVPSVRWKESSIWALSLWEANFITGANNFIICHRC